MKSRMLTFATILLSLVALPALAYATNYTRVLVTGGTSSPATLASQDIAQVQSSGTLFSTTSEVTNLPAAITDQGITCTLTVHRSKLFTFWYSGAYVTCGDGVSSSQSRTLLFDQGFRPASEPPGTDRKSTYNVMVGSTVYTFTIVTQLVSY